MSEQAPSIDTHPALPDSGAPPQLKQTSATPPPGPGRALFVVLMYLFLVPLVVGAVLGFAWAVAHAHDPQHGMDVPGIKAAFGLTSILAACVFSLIYVRRRWPTLWSLGTLPGIGMVRSTRGALVQGMGMGLAAQIIGIGATVLINGMHPPRQDIMQALYNLPTATAWIAGPAILALLVLLVPFTEEVVFRGVLMSGLGRRMRALPAAVTVTLVFAAAHLLGVGGHVSVLVGVTLLGSAAIWLRLRHQSLYPGMAAHMTFNAVAMIGVVVHMLHGS
ncbi:type II CAAX endopeptidase family protein [Oleiagrimonas sp. C23AA]|uniref:CPBP family intramembrane glutamic endopeptidase n=1 Tax=Oleiagrimonas sp. C23AA TaxID=2719047 RepID=UPI001420CD4C|nr:type II CAAX endopeptidase family protein [Oleiagrimonas sp. C23AA]NII09305.1 CPBP family intramembrane metalloprotease [Oleiagrimonas sp. C23AA]